MTSDRPVSPVGASAVARWRARPRAPVVLGRRAGLV